MLNEESFPKLLASVPFLVLDGALATELEERGADLNDPLWSARVLLESPELIRQVHFDYFRAGADVAISASYQASFEGFGRRGLSREETAALLRRSVELARQARDSFWEEPANRVGRVYPLVAASVGPYGAVLADGSEYRGDYGLTEEELTDWHRPRLAVLAGSGADLLALETIPSLTEARALVRLLPEFPAAVAWLSCSCRDGRRLSHGEPLARAAALAEESPQILAVGVNCTAPRYVESLLREARRATTKPLVAYPNSGERWDAGRHCWLPAAEEEEFGAAARRWYLADARLIGGCCRTGPEEIVVLRSLFSVLASQ